MGQTPMAGSEAAARQPVLPATFGGPGLRPRTASHLEEARGGGLWGSFGVQWEVEPLREVLLAWPGEELLVPGPPDEYLMLGRVDLALLQRQTQAAAAFFEAQGVRVHVHRPSQPPPPNFIFMRDLFFMTPEGAVLGRMAAQQRAGEERFAAEALARLGIPLVRAPRGTALLEGADALWLSPRTVLVGVGPRTNLAGAREVAALLTELGVETVPVPLPTGVQHLLGVVNFVDRDLAVLRRGKASSELLEALRSRGIRLLELEDTAEVVERRAMNFVTLEPGRLVMPAGCPHTRRLLEAAGLSCEELEVSQYILAGGALGCLTGIIRRGPRAP